MGLKDFFDDIIPNELKGNIGKIAAAGAAAYFGYKGIKSFTSPTGFLSTTMSAPGATGMTQYASGFDRLKGFVQSKADTPLGKFASGFGKQIAGQIGDKGDQAAAEIQARYEAQSKAMADAMRSRSYNVPSGVPMQTVGNFQASRAQVPGFKNPHVNESLNMMSYFMQDLNDNGRIDSSALYAEAPRGVTIGLPSSKSMKMSI